MPRELQLHTNRYTLSRDAPAPDRVLVRRVQHARAMLRVRVRPIVVIARAVRRARGVSSWHWRTRVEIFNALSRAHRRGAPRDDVRLRGARRERRVTWVYIEFRRRRGRCGGVLRAGEGVARRAGGGARGAKLWWARCRDSVCE